MGNGMFPTFMAFYYHFFLKKKGGVFGTQEKWDFPEFGAFFFLWHVFVRLINT